MIKSIRSDIAGFTLSKCVWALLRSLRISSPMFQNRCPIRKNNSPLSGLPDKASRKLWDREKTRGSVFSVYIYAGFDTVCVCVCLEGVSHLSSACLCCSFATSTSPFRVRPSTDPGWELSSSAETCEVYLAFLKHLISENLSWYLKNKFQ